MKNNKMTIQSEFDCIEEVNDFFSRLSKKLGFDSSLIEYEGSIDDEDLLVSVKFNYEAEYYEDEVIIRVCLSEIEIHSDEHETIPRIADVVFDLY